MLISHGANRFGGFTADGNYLGTSSGPAPGPLENINRNTLALRATSPNDFYIDTEFREDPAAYYDDIVCYAPHDYFCGYGGGSWPAQAAYLPTTNPQACTMRPQTSSPAVRRRSWQRGGAVLAVMAGLVVVAASTLAIRMARQVQDKTAQQQLTQQRGKNC